MGNAIRDRLACSLLALGLVLVASCGGGGNGGGGSDDGSSSSDSTTGGTSTTTATSSSGSTGPTSSSDGTTIDSSGTDDGASTGEPACPAPSMCVDAPPRGWEGPVALNRIARGDSPCGGGYPTPGIMAHDGLDDPSHTCGCTCNATANTVCDSDVILRRWSDSGCDDAMAPGAWQVSSACSDAVTGPGMDWWTAVSAVIGAECMPEPAVDIPPSAGFAEDYALCEPVSATCDDGTSLCVPPAIAPFEALCIHTDGDLPCPEGSFSEHSVLYLDFDDQRECTPCDCGPPSSPECTGYSVQLFNANGCSSLQAAISANGACQQSVSAFSITAARRTGTGTPSFDCDGVEMGGEAVGSLVPTDPITLCCLP